MAAGANSCPTPPRRPRGPSHNSPGLKEASSFSSLAQWPNSLVAGGVEKRALELGGRDLASGGLLALLQRLSWVGHGVGAPRCPHLEKQKDPPDLWGLGVGGQVGTRERVCPWLGSLGGRGVSLWAGPLPAEML